MMPAALILAGSRPGRADPVATAEGVAHKALVEVEGQPILARVIAALQDAGVERIAVAANDSAVVTLSTRLGAEVLPPAAGPSASVGAAFDRLGAPLLVTTSDHALLQGDWVRRFVEDTPAEADVSLLLARRETVEAALPGTRRTWLRLADGAWSGCNLFLLRTPRARAAIETWAAVEADRKRPWRIAARLGLGTLLDYALGRLGLAQAIARLGERIGIEARLVAAHDGRAAIDVDSVQDLADVRRIAAD